MKVFAPFIAFLLITSIVRADAVQPFSALPVDQQATLKKMVEPPPLSQRRVCYSTPMYYLMHAGYEYLGNEDKDPQQRCYPSMKGMPGPDFGSWKLDRNRPDWQEAMIRDWAELGLGSTHLNIYPQNKSLVIDANYAQAIHDFVALSEKYGLRVGVRLDGLDETVLWTVHPDNPHSRRSEYLEWARQIAKLVGGRAAYYVLGDELTLHPAGSELKKGDWTSAQYLDYFKQLSGAIKSVDPNAKVSMFAASSGQWENVVGSLSRGYAKYGDAVAINHYDYTTVGRFFADRDRLAPNLMFLTSGVGYISLKTIEPRYPQGDPYSAQPDEQSHAAAIARTMFTWWDLGADAAPYYISLRNWVIDGKIYPRWFGFFGFEDFVVENDKLTVKRYPGWYAYQAMAQTFYDRPSFKKPEFDVNCDPPSALLRCYEHTVGNGAELLIILWSDQGKPQSTTLTIHSDKYRWPVQISLEDFRRWSDVSYEVAGGNTKLTLYVGTSPVIARLFGR